MDRQDLLPEPGANAFEETLATLLGALSIGRYLVGEKLPPERVLATELKVSRATLRSALQALRDAGIVQVTRGRYGGTEVVRLPSEYPSDARTLDVEGLEDALRFRELLETGAARRAAAADLSAEQRRRLHELHDACAGAPMEQYRAYDSRFHIALVGLAGIPSLTRAVTDNRTRINAYLDGIPMMATNLDHSHEQHGELVAAVLSGDLERAERVALEHAQGTAALLRGFLSQDALGADPTGRSAHPRSGAEDSDPTSRERSTPGGEAITAKILADVDAHLEEGLGVTEALHRTAIERELSYGDVATVFLESGRASAHRVDWILEFAEDGEGVMHMRRAENR